MIYQEKNVVASADLHGAVKQAVSDLIAGRLALEGNTIVLPEGLDFQLKTKYVETEEGGALTIKIVWDNVVEEAAAEDTF